MKSALIIVDLQHEFIDTLDNKEYLDRAFKLIGSWPEDDSYWLRFNNHPDSLFQRILNWSECIASPEADLIRSRDITHKNIIDHSGYSITQKHIEMLKTRYRQAVVIGADTDACVLALSFSLWDNNIRPLILEDYCLSSDGEPFHSSAITIMKRQFGQISILKGSYDYDDIMSQTAL